MPRQTKPKTNDALRQWARGVSFTIAMGRRQVYTLVAIHASADRVHITEGLVGRGHRHLSTFITSAHCLIDRGLINAPVWGITNDLKSKSISPEKANNPKYKVLYKDCWNLTRAGELVIELLKEAGIYQEVMADLEFASKPKMRIA